MLLNKWKEKAKTSKFYSNAIVVWTKLDVQKRTIALKNNLKYYVIYNKFQYEQFKCYIKEIQINDN